MSSNVGIETETTEVECLDGSTDGDHSTYSRRLRSQMEEFRKFARWNSSLLYIIGFMIILVSCSAVAYFFLYDKEVEGELPQGQYQLNKYSDSRSDLNLIELTFPEISGHYCPANESVNVFLKLEAKNDMEAWDEWEFGCKGSVVQLSLEGPFSSAHLHHFNNLFGSTVTKILLYGSQICSSSQLLGSDARIFKEINDLAIFNSTEECDRLLSGFLEDIPKNLTIVEFNSVMVSQKLEKYIRDLVSSKQISKMQLQDLHYKNNSSSASL